MRRIPIRSLGLALVVAAIGAVWFARRIPVSSPPAPDYDLASSWLCRPGRDDACAKPTTATIFKSGGVPTVKMFTPDPAAPIDCFYVYPTVSRVRAAYAPIEAKDEERYVARHQLAPFGTACRPFAPLYRQVTSVGLSLLFGGKRGVTIDVPYVDVLAAWRSYLAKDNAGRGVVLIGHSQGSRLLARLIKEEIDGKPMAAKLVSAVLPGTWIYVPEGKVVGGTFAHTPLCTSAAQTGCVISYSAYPADRARPADPFFGVSKTPGRRFACVDPMMLNGAQSLDADLPLEGALKAEYGTDFAELPGLLTAACTTDPTFSVLAITAKSQNRDGQDTKAKLDALAAENPAFGLHGLDLSLALGTFLDLVHKQTAAYARH